LPWDGDGGGDTTNEVEHSALNGKVSRPQVGAWYVNLNDAGINWWAGSAAITFADRVEVSGGYGFINAHKYGDKSINTYNVGAKVRFLDENAFDTSWVPALAVGGVWKYTDSRTVDAFHLDNSGFDGYIVFDADNILSPDYIEQMNRTFSDGHDIITSYRNSKNFGDTWISAGYALWYLRESRYLNHARYRLHTSCAVGGTGFLFSQKVIDELGGWPFHMLVEDIEFSIHEITKGRKIAFCPDAILYDEQPTGFLQSWRQRERWCKGGLQVFTHYGP
jgi:hypothetical protein